MNANVLPVAFIALLVYGALQLAKSIVPAMNRWPNNCTRAIGYVLTFALLVVNRLVLGHVQWPDLWGLLPMAAAVYGGSALLYHVQDTGAGDAGSAAALLPADAQTIVAPADATVSVVSGPRAKAGQTPAAFVPPQPAPTPPHDPPPTVLPTP